MWLRGLERLPHGGFVLFNDYDHPAFPGVKLVADAYASAIGQPVRFVGKTGRKAGNVYVQVLEHTTP